MAATQPAEQNRRRPTRVVLSLLIELCSEDAGKTGDQLIPFCVGDNQMASVVVRVPHWVYQSRERQWYRIEQGVIGVVHLGPESRYLGCQFVIINIRLRDINESLGADIDQPLVQRDLLFVNADETWNEIVVWGAQPHGLKHGDL